MASSIFYGGQYGPGLQWADLGPPKSGSVDAAVTIGKLGRNEAGQSIFTGAEITINYNPGAPWFGGYPDRFRLAGNNSLLATYETTDVQAIYRAITLLHELGHAMNRIKPGSSIIREDGNDRARGRGRGSGVSSDNTRVVFEKCFK